MRNLAPGKNVLLLVGVVLLCAAARFYAERSYASALAFELRVPQDAEDAERLVRLVPMAIVGALVGSLVGYRLNRTSAAILGAVGGGVAIAHCSSIVGAAVGTPVGLSIAFLGPRPVMMTLMACTLALVVGTIGGATIGALAPGDVSVVAWATAACVGIAVAIGLNLVVHKVGARGGRSPTNRWRSTIGRVTLLALSLLTAIAAIPFGITLESVYRLRRLGGDSYTHLRPLDARCLTRGLVGANTWSAPAGIGGAALQKLRRFDGLVSLDIEEFGESRIDDDSLAALGDLPGLMYLTLVRTEITDRGLRHLRALNWLSNLDLDGTRVTGMGLGDLPCAPRLMRLVLDRTAAGDAFLAQIPAFSSLQTLLLSGTAVTDEGLQHMPTSPRLETLYLANTRVGDAGMARLAAIPMLRWLDLSGTEVTDAGLSSLAKSPRLTHLELRRTKVTDAGMVYLADFPALTDVDLSETEVTDAAVDFLANRRWRLLYLRRTKISPEGFARLRAAGNVLTLDGP